MTDQLMSDRDLQASLVPRWLWRSVVGILIAVLVLGLALAAALTLGWRSPTPGRDPDWTIDDLIWIHYGGGLGAATDTGYRMQLSHPEQHAWAVADQSLGDFDLGYSPERINPGDKKHSLTRIVKVVSGQDAAALERAAAVYGAIIEAGIHRAPNIKTAEASKVIENVQRDLNIALMNELSKIFARLGIHTDDVLAAAATKWNFHPYTPGLVGGHCIGVDPYYLTHRALEVGYHPEVILAGRRINDSMGAYVGDGLVHALSDHGVALKSAVGEVSETMT